MHISYKAASSTREDWKLQYRLQASGETSSGGSNFFDLLYQRSADWQALIKQMSEVLAFPLLLEYKRELIDHVINAALLGLTAACVVVPIAVPAVAGVAIACWSLRGASGERTCSNKHSS